MHALNSMPHAAFFFSLLYVLNPYMPGVTGLRHIFEFLKNLVEYNKILLSIYITCSYLEACDVNRSSVNHRKFVSKDGNRWRHPSPAKILD